MSDAFDDPDRLQSWLARADTYDARAREIREDFVRTRIVPGANPRAQWKDEQEVADARSFLEKDRCAVIEFYDDEAKALSVALVSYTWGWRFVCAPMGGNHHYVPVDVCRWRDPEHREALTKRAREYAAFLPGRKRCK